MLQPDPLELIVTLSHPAAIDAVEVQRAMDVLFDPDAHHVITAKPTWKARLIGLDDVESALAAVREFSGGDAMYYTMNPFPADYGHRPPRALSVLRRRWLLIDVDPATHDVMATEQEKTWVTSLTADVIETLSARGWPAPVVIDSGNGCQVLYRIDLPNDKLSQKLIAAALKVLGELHTDDHAHIDTGVHAAKQLAKLPGTWVRKGPPTADRPYRMARFLTVPETQAVVSVDQIRDLAGTQTAKVKADRQSGVSDPLVMTVETSTEETHRRYCASAVGLELSRVLNAPEGMRNNTLNRAAFALGTLLEPGHLNRSEIEAQLTEVARRAGLKDDEIEKTIRSGMDAGAADPRELPEPKADKKTKGKAANKDDNAVPDVLVIRASEVNPRVVNYLWKDRVPLQFITIFAGRTGLGKSFVTCDMTARLTTGRDFPDSSNDGECHSVLFISEDPYEFMLTPRLMELGADLTKVSFLKWEAMASYTLADVDFLSQAYDQSDKPRLIVIDPPTNFLGDVDEHSNSEVRAVLMKIAVWLKDHDAACVLITHVNKQSGKGIEAVNRVIGSIAWTTSCRIAHTFAPHPEDRSKCVFVPIKNNLGPLAKGLAYRIASTDSLATVEWLGTIEESADDVMGESKKPPRTVIAREWLIERFGEKLEWFSDDLFTHAKNDGISRNAVFAAKKELDLPKAKKAPAPNGKEVWVWWVPFGWKPPVNCPDQENEENE